MNERNIKVTRSTSPNVVYVARTANVDSRFAIVFANIPVILDLKFASQNRACLYVFNHDRIILTSAGRSGGQYEVPKILRWQLILPHFIVAFPMIPVSNICN